MGWYRRKKGQKEMEPLYYNLKNKSMEKIEHRSIISSLWYKHT